jgi:TatD DNase family protein
MVDKAMDVGECLTRFFAGGGELALDMAVHVRDGSAREELSERFPGVYIAAGIHPSEAGKVGGDDWILLRKQLSHPKALILGEIGLDWYRGRDNEGAQLELIRRQITLAQE